jgi:hypothetical protein
VSIILVDGETVTAYHNREDAEHELKQWVD